MKSTLLTIEKNPNIGRDPNIVDLGHRQLEKTNPEPLRKLGSSIVSYNVPVDLFNLLLDSPLVEDLESMEFHYRVNNAS